METTRTISSTVSGTEPEEYFAALLARWPQFSAVELRRLQFLAHRRATGRLRPAAPLCAAGARVCEEIAAYLRAPMPAREPQDAAIDVPPLWRAWMADQGPAHRWHNPQI